MKKLIFICAALSIAGCQSTGNMLSGLCQIEESIDTFENKAQVDFTKCWVPTGTSVWDTPSYKFTFTWYEADPSRMRLGFVYDSSVDGAAYTRFESVSINVNGTKYDFDNFSDTLLSDSGYNNITNTIYTTSRAGVFIPMSLFEEMITAEDVRIRLSSSRGYEDYLFHISKLGLKEYTKLHMPKYLATIDKYR